MNEAEAIKLSIVIPTCGRILEVGELLGSLLLFKPEISFEVLIIDQNFNRSLDHICEIYSSELNIRHFKVDFRSSSKARNYGLSFAKGIFVCFPDDDCKFKHNTIPYAISILEKTGSDAVFGKCEDEYGNDSVDKFVKKASFLTLDNFEGKFIEATIFAKKEFSEEFKYDENLGIGTFYGAEEGYDQVYRALKNGCRLYFDPNIVYTHPAKIIDHLAETSIRRVFTYRTGFGRLCKIHNLKYKFHKRLISVALYYFFLVLTFNRKRLYYFSEFLGLLVGYYV